MNARWPAAVPLALALAGGGCGRLDRATLVVLVTLDTTRADHLGCYGAAGDPTPNLDRLAAESVLFEQAVSPVPATLPAHATIFTGLYPQDHGVRYNLFFRLPAASRTLAEAFADAGYATAAFPASRIVGAEFGLDQGFETYLAPRDEPDARVDYPVRSASRSAGEIVDLAAEWLAAHEAGRAFVWLHFYDPHWPYAPPFPYSAHYRDRPYLGEIAYADAQLGRLLERLRADPRWDRTLLVVAGDHGEGLYDHGERWHTTLVYETTQRVPLIVRAPGARAARVTRPVGLADVMPTILDLAGLAAPAGLRGISLRPALQGGDLPNRPIYFETLAGSLAYGWAELRGVRHDRWKLIDAGEGELFDLQADPAEETNLAAAEPGRLKTLRAELRELAEPADASDAATAVRLDPDTRRRLSDLGYVGGGSLSLSDRAPLPRTLIDLEPELIAAQGAAARGQMTDVERTCRYVLQRDPTNRWALLHLPQALSELQRGDEALEHARTAVATYPRDEAAYETLARVHRARGELGAARAALNRGLAVLPDSEGLRYLDLAAAFDDGADDVCAALVPAAVATHPDSGRILVLQGRCQARDGDAEQALETVGAAVRLGFRRLDLVEATDDFSAVTRLPGFRELVEATPAQN